MNENIRTLREHPVLRFAAEELARLTAAYEAPGGDAGTLTIGTWSDFERASPESAWPWSASGTSSAFDEDSYAVVEREGETALAGKSERAALYAVYHYCKRRWRLEWVLPGESEVRVDPNCAASDAGAVIEPLFSRRGFVYEHLKDEPYLRSVVDWMGKNRVNELFLTFPLWHYLRDSLEPELEKRGIELTLGGHSMRFFTERRLDLWMNGNTNPNESEKKQLDYADPSWQEEVIGDIVDYCRASKAIRRLSLWPEDTAKAAASDSGGSFLEGYIRFTERLEQAAQEAGLDVEVEHIAYNAGLSWRMLELEQSGESSPRVDTLFAYWGRDYGTGYDDAAREAERRAFDALKAWNRATKAQGRAFTIFEYYSDHFMLSYLFPALHERIYEDLEIYRTLGIDRIVNLVVPYPQAGPDYSWKWAQAFNSYTFAQAVWGESPSVVKDRFWSAAAREERERLRELMDRTADPLARLTRYNVPLFPHRAVDAAKADAGEAHEIIAILQEIIQMLEDDVGAFVRSREPADRYFAHLLAETRKLENEWIMKRV